MSIREKLADWISGGLITHWYQEFLKADAARRNAQTDFAMWADVVQWTDADEKTLVDWVSGGADPDGEFARLGLRREMPNGKTLYRHYVALSPWREYPKASGSKTP